MKASFLAAALMGFAVLLGAADTEAVKPVLNDRSIQIGNKTLKFDSEGRIRCNSKEGDTLFVMNMYLYLTVNGKDDYSWRTKKFDKENSKFERSGNLYVWNLQYQGHDDANVVKLHQEMEVLPDGKIKFSAKFEVPENTETHVYHTMLSFQMKDAVWANETVDMTGTPLVLDPSIKKTLSGTKNPVWTFGTTNPAKKFTLSIKSDEMRFFQLQYRKFNSSYTLFFTPFKEKQDYIVYLDFAQEK